MFVIKALFLFIRQAILQIFLKSYDTIIYNQTWTMHMWCLNNIIMLAGNAFRSLLALWREGTWDALLFRAATAVWLMLTPSCHETSWDCEGLGFIHADTLPGHLIVMCRTKPIRPRQITQYRAGAAGYITARVIRVSFMQSSSHRRSTIRVACTLKVTGFERCACSHEVKNSVPGG